MRTSPADRLATALFGKGKRAILALLFAHPDRRFYLREIARAAGITPSVLQRDLASLTEAGILERADEGRQVYYRANEACPIFPELKGLVTKTFGVGDVLRAMLEPHAARIALAFVYGSVASGTHTGKSDVDLMIVGDLDVSAIAQGILDAEAGLGRPINPTVYAEKEFRDRVLSGNHFVTTVLSRPIVYIIGNKHELEQLTQRKPATTRRTRAVKA